MRIKIDAAGKTMSSFMVIIIYVGTYTYTNIQCTLKTVVYTYIYIQRYDNAIDNYKYDYNITINKN